MRVKLGAYNERPINKLGTARYAFMVSNRRQQNAPSSGAVHSKGFVPHNRRASRDADLNPLDGSSPNESDARLGGAVNFTDMSPSSHSAISSSAAPPAGGASSVKKPFSPSFNAYCGRRQAAPGVNDGCGSLGCSSGALGVNGDDCSNQDCFTTMTPGRTKEEVKGGGCFSGAKSYVANIFLNCLSFTEKARGPSSKFRRRFQSDNERRMEQDLVARLMLQGRDRPHSPSLATISCPPSSPNTAPKRALPHDFDNESQYLLEEDEESPTDFEAISQCPYDDDVTLGPWSPRSLNQDPDNGGVERRNTMCMNHVYWAPDSSAKDDGPFQGGLCEDRITDEQQRRKSTPHDLFTSSGELQQDILCELGTQRTPEQRAHLQMLLSMFSRVNQETLSRCPSVDCCSASVCSLSCHQTTISSLSCNGKTMCKKKGNLTMSTEDDEHHHHAHTQHQHHQTIERPAPMREWECEREMCCVLPPSLGEGSPRGGSTRQDPNPQRRNTVFGLQFAHNHSSAPVLCTTTEDADDADADLPPSYDDNDIMRPKMVECEGDEEAEDDVQDWSPGRASVGCDEEAKMEVLTKPFGDLPKFVSLGVNTETNGSLNEDEVKKVGTPNTSSTTDTALTHSSTNNSPVGESAEEKDALRASTRAMFEEEGRVSSCAVILRDSIEPAPLLAAPRFVA